MHLWATLWERIFTDALTSSSLRSLGAKKPGQAAGEGAGLTSVCFHTPSSHCCPGETELSSLTLALGEGSKEAGHL